MDARNLPCGRRNGQGKHAPNATALGHTWPRVGVTPAGGQEGLHGDFLVIFRRIGRNRHPLPFGSSSTIIRFDCVPLGAPPWVEPASVSGVRDLMALLQPAVAALTWLSNPATPAWTSL